MRPSLRLFSSLFLFLYCTATASADKVDDFVRREMQRQQIPGVSLAVVQGGKVIKLQGYGFANVEHRVAATPDTIYQSGSVGKQFTAVLLLLLAEQGKLNLDDPISRYFPGAPEFWKSITVRHILSHTSGLPDYGTRDLDMRKDYTQEELLAYFYTLKPLYRPGSFWSYSNVAYVLAGFIAERVEGKPYHELVEQRIFAPLNMKTARGMEAAEIVPNRAAGYVLSKDKRLENEWWVAPALSRLGDGSLYFSANDMLRWEGALRQRALLDRKSYDVMWTATSLVNGGSAPYGLGWFVSRFGGHDVVHHTGHWQGFSTAILRDVSADLSVILLSNLGDVPSGKLARAIASLYVPELAEPTRTAKKVAREALRRYEGRYSFFDEGTVTLKATENGLEATAKGPFMEATDRTFTLAPESEASFFNDDVQWVVTFRQNTAGEVTHLVMHRYGGEFIAPRRKE